MLNYAYISADYRMAIVSVGDKAAIFVFSGDERDTLKARVSERKAEQEGAKLSFYRSLFGGV